MTAPLPEPPTDLITYRRQQAQRRADLTDALGRAARLHPVMARPRRFETHSAALTYGNRAARHFRSRFRVRVVMDKHWGTMFEVTPR